MSRDILSEFGPDSPANQKPRATSGGVTRAKELPYSPPQGPKNQYHERPGLGGGSQMGHGQRFQSGEESGHVGIDTTNHGCCGSQGKH